MTALNKNILIMAGGTGGHIFPALSVANELRERGYQISWLGSKGGMEEELVKRDDFPIFLLPVTGIRGKGLLALLKAPFVLMNCVMKALRIIKHQKIGLVAGFGGFASGPGGLAAKISGRQLIVHEQNAIAGMTNRILSKKASVVCEAFANTFERNNDRNSDRNSNSVYTTGNPIRAEIINAAEKKSIESITEKSPLNVLIIGGSRGAKIFNDSLPGQLTPLIKANKISVWHQSGKHNSETVKGYYPAAGSEQIIVSDFIHDMAKAYQWADVIICRAGALTVSEVAVMGLAALFVPYPHAVDDHQTKNAESLVNAGGALMIPQAEINQLVQLLEPLIEKPKKIQQMALAAKSFAITNASQRIADYCETLLKSEKE
ncbi:undecaprenyldiphospho-muramoylpentapeptide beta-N-acetylglucosaminyltransferase [Pleionea mediterranea]|uniref:UDP-N-acetylglucosamine--N-acetylmuramyl-(pentapeptide) pyrophosphoryl-undecaprenol N-acetylglucosamine transferase n=1 Tax=Pleionea mediterranea TaxID=523701 RepID=A0A316FIJ9_9GAMM|nr:undecaprenyldiphospho-muramoylpentapeptide beta-N-acetylglucosaminyltransferase [Pleionea mediterranea]PWK47935.1 UDP-N-acetylglucosamine-N-acetylmuramylpentapeptide N-acetylglucosamine transferase [Pleionea mediterranea]